MTAPDDLARTLAKHVFEPGMNGAFCYGCDWTPRHSVSAAAEHRVHLAEVLASVVSRRDADLRTRIEKLAARWRCDCDPGPEGQHRDGCASWFRDQLTDALVGDTREDAPVCARCGPGRIGVEGCRHAPSRVPADTDTGRGQ